MASHVLSELLPWQSKRFREYELPWTRAAESLLGDEPLIEVRSNKDGSRWTVYNKATNKIAIFSHAGLWCWASPPETGNFVPEGESAPEGVHSSRIVPMLCKKIETSYAFNTEDDPSFYSSARILEDHATSLKGFNRYKKPRRTWQEGDTEFARRRFILSSRLVLRRTPHNSKDGPPIPPAHIHPWLRDALVAQRYPLWIANPEMPAILDYEDGKLSMIKPTSHRYFENGDIVWFSFALSFDVNSNNWMPEYKPLDFIRVGALPRSSDTGDYSAAEAVGSAYQSLAVGSARPFDDTDPASMAIDDLLKDDLKRRHDSDGDDTMSDGGLSDKSAYSVALAALEASPKRQKLEDGSSKSVLSKSVVADEVSKKKTHTKGKGK